MLKLKNVLAYMAIAFISQPLIAQNIIRGKILDAATGVPVTHASIYYNGTQTGTTSDSLGNFSLHTLKTNSALMVSCIGYSLQQISSPSANVIIRLKPREHQLQEVVIDANRGEAMKIFLREFIGPDYKNCPIINKDDIWLKYNKTEGTLLAESDKPLIIRNKPLAYKITFFLNNFSYVPPFTNYTGNYLFEDDTAGLKPAEIKKAFAARNEVYKGSRMHFIRALWANQLRQNGFAINTKGITYSTIVKIENDGLANMQKLLVLKSTVFISYRGELSTISPATDNLAIVIDANGFYGAGLEWRGTVGVERVSALLPLEFHPDQ